MCKLCETNPVYEFTNQRKLCKRCFIDYFNKKFLFTIRKFEMINGKDIIGYVKGNDVKSVVLEEMLNFISEKYNFNIVRLSSKNLKVNKIAVNSSLDSESEKILDILINKKVSELKSCFPVVGNEIKPLYLFLDEEILLFAKLKGFKFKEDKKSRNKVEIFADEFEKNHPEVKRAVVNSVLKLYFK
jgi:tRNA(Ile)-lysidine synthase TilS/MesJ